MASIQSTLNAINLIVGPREDLASADVVECSLDDTTGVITYQWYMIGRPEQSEAGSPGSVGPDFLPVDLGVAATCTFTVDSDNYVADVFNAGTYLVMLTVNAGTPTEAVYRCTLSRLNADGNLTYDPRSAAYASSRIPSFKEIRDDALDSWGYAVERFMVKHTLLMDFRCGTWTVNILNNPETITWNRNFITNDYLFFLTPIIVAPATYFSVVGMTKDYNNIQVTYLTDSLVDVFIQWLCIVDLTTSS